MSFEINEALSWMQQAFGVKRNDREETALPNRILGDIRPQIEAAGWARYTDLIQLISLTDGVGPAVNFVNIPATGRGLLRLVLSFSASHDDPVARTARFGVFNSIHPIVAITNDTTASQNEILTTGHNPGPVILPEGFGMTYQLSALGAGNVATGQALVLNLEAGEYIPHPLI